MPVPDCGVDDKNPSGPRVDPMVRDVLLCVSEDDDPVSRYIHETTEGDYEDVRRILPGMVVIETEFE